MHTLQPTWQSPGEASPQRFAVANERTFLAGVCGAVGVQAVAVAVTGFVDIGAGAAETTLGAAVATLGVALPLIAYRRWARTERDPRRGRVPR
ncbi:hypothetical protein GCM10023094_29050 [Rhodococcus olei]|uniref:DUF202 domain-containing protein n=1 Tax=Rhodococcus olei TaxID=2161675 RepID=A0ABP8P343_9NOCA